jgi:hypothetical protein
VVVVVLVEAAAARVLQSALQPHPATRRAPAYTPCCTLTPPCLPLCATRTMHNAQCRLSLSPTLRAAGGSLLPGSGAAAAAMISRRSIDAAGAAWMRVSNMTGVCVWGRV